MSQFTLMAHITAATKDDPILADEIATLAAATRREAGCLRYQVCRDVSDASCWLIYEVWDSLAHWQAHLETAHLLHFKESILPAHGTLTVDKYPSI
jgi:quinol monooxygenase YgiN